MINLNASFSGNSASPTTDYPYGSARNITTTGDNTGTPFVASLQNDIIGNQQYLLQEAAITPNNTPDNATTSQQFEAMWKIFNKRTFTKNLSTDSDYTLTSRENLKTRIVITDTTPVLTTGKNIIVDKIQKEFIAINNTNQILTFKTSDGTGIAVSPNTTKILYGDGTNIININYGNLSIANLFMIQDQKASGTTGDTLTLNTWKKSTKNTVVINNIGVVVSSSVMTLLPGTYYAENEEPVGVGNPTTTTLFKSRLRNVSDSTTLISGGSSSERSNAATNEVRSDLLKLQGLFTISGNKNVELEIYNSGTVGINGSASSTGEVEVYGTLKIWKVA